MATLRWVAISVMEVRRCPTLPQGPPCSTIGAERLSFRVRNVTGRFPLAMAAETLSMFQSTTSTICCCQIPDRTSGTTQWTQAPWNGVLSSHRLISTSQLHALLRFHIWPINPVVWLGASHPEGYGSLILRPASRLDAFSGYPSRT